MHASAKLIPSAFQNQTTASFPTAVYLLESTINMPAIDALVKVEMTPEINADKATLATRPLRLGASWESTPICMPTEEILPKPQTA